VPFQKHLHNFWYSDFLLDLVELLLNLWAVPLLVIFGHPKSEPWL
jgi:hypothetical protein